MPSSRLRRSVACPSGGRLWPLARVGAWTRRSDGRQRAGVHRHAGAGAGRRVRRLAQRQDAIRPAARRLLGRDREEARRPPRQARQHQVLRHRRLCVELSADVPGAASQRRARPAVDALPRRQERPGEPAEGKAGAAGPRRLPRRRAASTTASSRRASPSASSSAATPRRRSPSASPRSRSSASTRWRRAATARPTCRPAFNPITKKGKPISSALGYAQLLHANTIGELVKHGDQFVKRLQRLKASSCDPAAHRRAASQDRLAAAR